MKILINLIKYFPRKIKSNLLKNISNEIKHLKKDIEILNEKTMQNDLLIRNLIEISLDKQFYSQYFQDVIAYFFLKRKTDGFYIDIGAHDGVTISNTYFFEQIGWKGICVEPLPEIFVKLQKNRKCELINTAIADKCNNNAIFNKVLGPDMLSGLDSNMTITQKERIKNEKGAVEHINVKTITFDMLMQNYQNNFYIDFLSLDVEGAEMSILKTINFEKYSFGIITIENNEPDNILVEYMQKQGYCVYCKTGCDIMFIKV